MKGISKEDSETQVESEAKDAEKNIDDNGTTGNQFRIVTFMCTTYSARVIFTKKSRVARCLFFFFGYLQICNADRAVLTKIERQFSNKVILKLKLTIYVFYKKCSPIQKLFNKKNFKKIQTIFGLEN